MWHLWNKTLFWQFGFEVETKHTFFVPSMKQSLVVSNGILWIVLSSNCSGHWLDFFCGLLYCFFSNIFQPNLVLLQLILTGWGMWERSVERKEAVIYMLGSLPGNFSFSLFKVLYWTSYKWIDELHLCYARLYFTGRGNMKFCMHDCTSCSAVVF